MTTTTQPGRRARGLATLPVGLVASALLVTAAAAYLDTRTAAPQREAVYAGYGVVTAVIGAVLVAAAAVILRERPWHAVGVVLAALGMVWAVDGLMESWSAYSWGTTRPGTDLAIWFVARFGSTLLLGLPLILVLYPTGRLMGGRWRAVSIATIVLAATLPVTLLLAPDEVVFRDTPLLGVQTDWVAVPLPEAAVVPVLVVARLLTLGAVLLALVVVVARQRSASGVERTQLRWLLWAGIVCALSAVLLGLLPSGGLTTLILATAVILTAVSVAIGVVRPELADVDALVAGTLTYAGVAAVVVGLDLAVLALTGALLGERMSERDVSLVVLVLAVAVYGPLRTWVGAGVRRLMFGRRGDRYDVVSAFAARMEKTRTVEEQLPTLADAVASTFKVPFVRVQVFVPGGGALAASHGARTTDTQEVDIGYRGEPVGRLELPQRGLRSMLSRRDQTLLVDLVRQAAIAIRASLLADALQESRETLVLGREDDRRRIRRDLHDGLGPALGGVAMRLDAAANVVERDPSSARQLIRLARTEVTDALDDVRRLVHDLRPPALDDLGLEAALEQQAERVRSKVAVMVDAGGLGALPAAVEVAAYRIVSEALTNVVKHAAAASCSVRLARVGSALEIEVTDDGRGIGEDVSAGVGLLSLRERAEELGGRCEVSCPDVGGTRVWAWLPMGEGAR
ncbi:MAG: sensor histidine kinase [Nocardioides sp.]